MVKSKQTANNATNLEQVLDKFSIYSCYFTQTATLILLTFVTNSIYSCNYIFVAEKVTYRCQDINYNISNNNSSDCKKWFYDDQHTFVAEFQLANQEWKRTLVGTTHSTGYMFGLVIVGPLSDKFGRKNTLLVTAVLGGIIGLARSFSPWYWLYIALEFLEAAVGDSCSPAYILITEIVSKKHRIEFIIICTFGYTLGGLILPLTAWLFPYWRSFLRVVYTPALFFVFYKFLLDESPRWLLIKGKKEKAIQILEKMATKNNIKLDKNSLDNLTQEQYKEVSYITILSTTFRSKLLRRRFLVCLIWWITCTFVSYGLSINSVSLQGNKYFNYALMALVELPGIFVITYLLIRCKRKLPLMFCFIASGIFCMSQPFVPSDLPWLSVSVYMTGKLLSSFYFSITYLYTSELFPTYTRNSMHALCSSLGRIGSITAPQTPLLMSYWSGIPPLLCGALSIIAGLLTLLVPDISNDALPDTVKQAEQLGQMPEAATEVSREKYDESRL